MTELLEHPLVWIAVAIAAFSLLLFFLHKQNTKSQKHMEDSFKSLSFDVLQQSSKAFLQLAEGRLEKYQEGARVELEGRHKSIEQTLKKLDDHQRELEKRREGAYSALQQQIEQMMVSDRELRKETAQLASALRSPQLRGAWGQIHLRRVVELAGLVNQCDFAEQVSVDAGMLRPDLVIRLPGQRHIVVDAKTPLNAYLDAADIQEEERRKHKLQEHAGALRKHIRDLSSKEYWKHFNLSPEYVILFLPAESFFSMALQADPTLIEVGADQNIIIATPTTLIAILRAVAFGWKQESFSKSAQEIAKLGAELYDRLGTMAEHWSKLGRQLTSSVDAYNQSVASLESRVLVSAKKLKEFGGLAKELPQPEQIEKLPRHLQEDPLKTL
ncbi:MAG: DNA recombination protein RmuC [Verrucomicrobiota bacterium]|nr:DNA recombination protein RmuC [Verrucomicrobiota bacterium]